jgi:dTMP kinase
MSLFITFEGGEGSGKSFQSKALFRRLSEQSIPVLLTREPGGTPFGRKISHWLKWAEDTELTPLTELMLFNASRAQLVAEVINPALRGGKVVISDRFADSTTVYQGYGRRLDLKMVKAVNEAATQGLKPDLTVLLDAQVEMCFERKGDCKLDRFEREATIFHHRVRDGYLELASEEPKRWLVVDASQSRAKITEIIWQKVSQLLKARKISAKR